MWFVMENKKEPSGRLYSDSPGPVLKTSNQTRTNKPRSKPSEVLLDLMKSKSSWKKTKKGQNN